MFTEIEESSRKQYIDASQARTAYLQFEKYLNRHQGSMYWNNVSGYEYLMYAIKGVAKSLGVRSAETEHIYTMFVAGKKTAKTEMDLVKKTIQRHGAVNRALQVGQVPNIVIDILEKIRMAGMEDNFFTIGTNAIYAYITHAGVKIDTDLTATTDVDFLWDSRKSIALVENSNVNEQGFIGLLRSIDPTFKIVDDQKFRAVNTSGYFVDLIKRRAPSLFDDHESNRIFGGVDEDLLAAKIVNMDWFLSSPKFKQTIVGLNGKMAEMVTVDPRAFVLFKVYLSQKENRSVDKKPRDLKQAMAIYELIATYFPHYAFGQVTWFPERVMRMLEDKTGVQKEAGMGF